MERRHDLDWVRVCAFGLLVLYHVGMYYVTWDWHVNSAYASRAAEPLMLLSAPWRLSLLFLVSGVATAFLLGKRSTGFLRARSWRLLVPLAFGMLVIVPPQSYFEVVEKAGYADGFLAFWLRYLAADGSFCRDGRCLVLPTWNHLWFVAYLWVYTALLWLGLRLLPGVIGRAGARLSTVLSGIGLLLWPALLLGLARIGLIGTFGSTHGLVDDWYNHVQYFGVFALGFLIARADRVWERMQHLRWPALAIGLACWGFLVVYFNHYSGAGSGVEITPGDAIRQFQRGIWGLFQWSAIVAILGFARHWAPGDSRALRYLSQAVFPVYILHQTVIVTLAHALKPVDMKPLLEAPLLIVATFALCFAAYEIVRRIALLRPLFGLKRERLSRGEIATPMSPALSPDRTAS